ncbi:MAG: hypothetical protein NVSMB69_09240 [Novosphingobium sp.]
MPFLSALTLLAQAFSPLPAVPVQDIAAGYGKVACHPDPSKNRGCFRDFPGTPTAQVEVGSKSVKQHVVSCSPDPGKNQDCSRTLDQPAKTAVYAEPK